MPRETRVLILANRSKEPVTAALRDLRPWLGQRAAIVGEYDTGALTREQVAEMPDADMAVVLGGDGTMLSQARLLHERDVPLLGINFGKLGFLAEFSVESFQRHWDAITANQCRQSRRLMLRVDLLNDDGSPVFSAVGMNDAVVNAGPPFRIIEIGVAFRPPPAADGAATILADGIIVSTPSGSTAYNLAAGGPIVSPGIDGICVAAICPHTLAFRPIVASADCEIELTLRRVNHGSQLVIDGQMPQSVKPGQRVVIRRHPRTVTLIHNPDYNYWQMLAHKMRWAVAPQRD